MSELKDLYKSRHRIQSAMLVSRWKKKELELINRRIKQLEQDKPDNWFLRIFRSRI